MKLFISCCLALVLILAGSPSQALEELIPYDNFRGTVVEFFNGKPIDPDRWLPSGTAERDILDFVRENRWNRLHLLDRTYGDTDSTVGRKNTAVRVIFPAPDAVTAIMIEGIVKDFELTGCVGNDRIRALRASGFFFNTGKYGTPAPGGSDATSDMLASIYLERRVDDVNLLPREFKVFASATICKNADCFDDELVFKVQLGTVQVNQEIRLLIQLDQDNSQFIFQRDNEPEVFYGYGSDPRVPTDKFSPGFSQKRLGVSPRVTNCTVGPGEPRPVAFVETLINKVFVNESAAPAP